MITFDDFKKVEMKIGEILSAERVEGSEKLLKLSVNFAEETPRQVISGIGKYFADLNTLVGKRYAFVTNLEPRSIMGLESQAMIVAASTDEDIAFFDAGQNIPPGTLLK
jgi:methionine--tRNA ligase beta chain